MPDYLPSIILFTCVCNSIIIAGSSNQEVINDYSWMGLERARRSVRNSVIGLILNAVSVVLLVFSLNLTPFFTVLTGIVGTCFVLVLLFGCWNSVQALWRYWRQTRHF